MPLNAEQRRTRARLAANSRHHPDQAGLLEADRAEFIDRHIDAVVRAMTAGGLKPEQRDRISRVFRYGPAPESDTAA